LEKSSRQSLVPITYAGTGFVLGLGAPLGALLLRILTSDAVRRNPLADLRANAFFYIYALVGTCIVFAAAGYIAGRRAERLARAERFYHELAEHDPLTGLFNTRALRDASKRAIERAVRYGLPVSLLVIDVDLLKQINDREGHVMGNAALRHVASALRAVKRADDLAARWGGDEFALLLEGADTAAALRVAEQVIEYLHANPMRMDGGPLPVSVTIGIAAGVPTPGAEDFFAVADRALYDGKQGGRDQARVGAFTADHRAM